MTIYGCEGLGSLRGCASGAALISSLRRMPRKKPKSDRPRSIAVEGPVGVGKTTLARILAKRLEARTVFEEVDQNPFLKEFYRDPGRYAFQTQMFFLLSRYKQMLDLKQEELFRQSTVCDYIFQKD